MNEFRILFALSTADAAGLATFHRVAAEALAFDGYAPFNEQALYDLQAGLRTAYLVTVPPGDFETAREPGMAVSTSSTSGVGNDVAGNGDVLGNHGFSESDTVTGAALAGRGEIDLVISPEHRRRGFGRTAFRELADLEPHEVTAWSHGDHPAARALASELRFVAVRTLLELRKPLFSAGPAAEPEAGTAGTGAAPETEAGASDAASEAEAAASEAELAGTGAAGDGGAGVSVLGDASISGFRVGVDDAEWVALNSLVFTSHPEQGAITEADLAARQAEGWFDADDFLILRDADGRMIGYNWLKVDGAIGEIYVVGVHPDAAGRGLGRVLMQAGLKRLADHGCTTAALYVEADSLGPVHLYRALGFVDHTVDVQYRRLTD
ncbi:GNAT family N-acetyltransferase [Cryobacterium sp. PH31-L1]|uniref:GNAT family N-acetyltransferase n=1 Tax=Cryobacterium sp. PH31-L1 TaxID=3046199 RepID=UPI0024BB714D|nr:GNAT family N-acetyltransferase [Cryobacterium sp. PH31-L1]MDJ0377015.1 GNAT family N-acetyltransferase [Cryobacterium sp. PH31-L1]